jgi:S-formylglutathione hydrolase
MFRSLSAFSPICTTLYSPWGRKALGYYLGSDTISWQEYDASEVARATREVDHWGTILVDQGLDDPFLVEQLQPDRLESACQESGLQLEVRRHAGYDHGYYFISTFIEEHLRFHATRLGL